MMERVQLSSSSVASVYKTTTNQSAVGSSSSSSATSSSSEPQQGALKSRANAFTASLTPTHWPCGYQRSSTHSKQLNEGPYAHLMPSEVESSSLQREKSHSGVSRHLRNMSTSSSKRIKRGITRSTAEVKRQREPSETVAAKVPFEVRPLRPPPHAEATNFQSENFSPKYCTDVRGLVMPERLTLLTCSCRERLLQ
jgi:hypothetical protein